MTGARAGVGMGVGVQWGSLEDEEVLEVEVVMFAQQCECTQCP